MRSASTVEPVPRNWESCATTTFDFAAGGACWADAIRLGPALRAAALARQSLRKSRRLALRMAVITLPTRRGGRGAAFRGERHLPVKSGPPDTAAIFAADPDPSRSSPHATSYIGIQSMWVFSDARHGWRSIGIGANSPIRKDRPFGFSERGFQERLPAVGWGGRV